MVCRWTVPIGWPHGTLNSASRTIRERGNCCAFNLKLEKPLIQGERGLHTLSSLIRAYFEQGGTQLQINVLDTAELRKAKKNPSAYTGLLVRVSGYCAYFNDLSPEVQDEIIERTAHSL